MGDLAKPWAIGPYFQSTKMLGERGCKTKYPNVYSPFGKLSPFLSCVNCRQSEATRHTLLLPLIKAQSDFLLGITASLLCSCTAIIHTEMNTQAGSPQGLTLQIKKWVLYYSIWLTILLTSCTAQCKDNGPSGICCNDKDDGCEILESTLRE